MDWNNDADLATAPDWFSQWVADVKARGGVPCRMPPGITWSVLKGGGDAVGELAERYPTNDVTHPWRYELAPLMIRDYDKLDSAIADAFGLDNGLPGYPDPLYAINGSPTDLFDTVKAGAGVVAKTAVDTAAAISGGIPFIAWAALGVVAYGALVTAGVLPPVRELLGARGRHGGT